MIPKADLLAYCDTYLRGVRERPRMYGGPWEGVETVILDHLGLREFVLAHPHAPPPALGCRWCTAHSRVHRESNGTLAATLAYDGVVDEEQVRLKYNAALDEFERVGGLYGRWLRHGQCLQCEGKYHDKDGPQHCTGGCGTWPCTHADGDAEVARWRAILGMPPL